MANEIERGRRMLREYLNSQNDCLDVRTRNRLFSLFEKNYIDHMNGDPDYFNKISEFLNTRKTAEKKEAFCYEMVKQLCRWQDIRKAYREKWPEDYA